jgi:sugar phosphate isomerase/epimerase
MNARLTVAIIVCMVTGAHTGCNHKKLDNTFYVQNTLNGFTDAPQTAPEKAQLVKAIGFDGLEGMGYKDFFELKNALDKEGLEMPVNYVPLEFELDTKPDSTTVNEIKAMIKASAKGAIIYFHLHSSSFNNDKETGDKMVARILVELSDYAAPFGVKLCVYPHTSFYCETVAHSVKLAKMVNRKNYGAVMNLCHLLKVEGSEGIDDKIKEFTPFLFAVNICGADDGDTRLFSWDRLIQPLGQGSFDTYHFIKSLRDNSYCGPVGLQCYNLKGDAVITLSRSFETWKGYRKQYSDER